MPSPPPSPEQQQLRQEQQHNIAAWILSQRNHIEQPKTYAEVAAAANEPTAQGQEEYEDRTWDVVGSLAIAAGFVMFAWWLRKK